MRKDILNPQNYTKNENLNESQKQQFNIVDVMTRLSDLGWKNQFDTFDTYYKKINNYEVIVSKHIDSKCWSVTLVSWDESRNYSDEITMNYNATFDWVIQLTEVLSNST
jgi:hypothetical protein